MATKKNTKTELQKLTESEAFELFFECYPLFAYNLNRKLAEKIVKKKFPHVSREDLETYVIYLNDISYFHTHHE